MESTHLNGQNLGHKTIVDFSDETEACEILKFLLAEGLYPETGQGRFYFDPSCRSERFYFSY